MSPSFRQPRTLPLALLLFALLAFTVLGALAPVPASAEGAPYKEVPGYPKYGCYDVITGGNGMWGGSTPYAFNVNVPGPVVDAYLVWVGTEDVGAPNSPNQSDLSVNGATVVGSLVDSTKPGAGDPWWYMWRANVGPSGQNLVKQGGNSYNVSGWNFLPDGATRRNGISLVVVYGTGACLQPNQVDLIDSFDYYWERQTGTTDVLAFTFPPMPVDRDVTVWLHHAGSDHVTAPPVEADKGASIAAAEAVAPSACRQMNLWAKTGSGAPPSTLIDYSATPPAPAYGGKRVVTNPFVGMNCGTTSWTFPVTGFTGWDYLAWNWKRDVGGYIAPEWSIAKVTVRVRANETYLALQLESEKTGSPDVEQTGESAAWFAQAVIPIQDVKLRIAKTDGVDTAKPGDTLTYTLNYENYGATPTADTTIVDTLPERASFVSASNGGAYDAATRTVKWNLGTVAGGAKGSVTLTVKLDPVFPAGTTPLTNTTTISTSTGGEQDLTDNTATDTTNVVAQAELTITKSGAPEPVDAGSNLTYTINWTVGGDAFSDDVMIVDTLPANVTFVSASNGGTFSAGKVTWNLGNLTPVKTGTVTLVVQVKSPQLNGTAINNSVTITNEAGDTDTATATNTVRSDHELTITKADDPDPVEKGTNLAYTITWGVTGNEPAQALVITDPIPFGTTFVSAGNGGVYDNVTKTVTWTLGDKVPGDTGAVTLVVNVNADFPNGIKVENTATISDARAGKEKQVTELTNVVQTEEGVIGDTVWLDLNKNGVQEPGEPGISGVGLVLYNAGPDGACGGGDDVAVANTVTDANGKYSFKHLPAATYCVDVIDATVPAGMTLVSGTDPRKVTLGANEVFNGADFGYWSALGRIGDLVWSDANGNGVKDAGEVGIGGVTLDLYNAGADGQCDTADDAKLASTTTAPDGTYFFGELAAGQYCVRVTDTAGKLTGLTRTKAPVQPITLASGQAFLDADFGYQGLCGEVGDFLFYDANRNGVFDAGPQERGISGVTLSLRVAGADGEFGTADDVTIATVTTDANGAYLFTGLPNETYHVVVTDLAGRLVGYTQTLGLPNTNNNGQPSPFPVTIDGCTSIRYADFAYADGHLLTIVKTNNLPVGEPVEAGGELIWTLAYSVSGRGASPNAVITDELPAQVDFVSASNGGTYNSSTRVVTWNLGNLEPGTSGSVTLTVRVKKPLDNNSYIFNTAVITDDAKVRDESTNIVRVHAEPILNVTKTNTPAGTVKPGDTITYQVCFSNTGNGNANNAVLTDPIPVNTTYVPGSATGGATFNEATKTLSWSKAVLGPDENVCGTFKVTVNLVITGLSGATNVPMSFAEWNAMTIDNTATIVADGVTPKSATVSNPLDATVNPVIYKSAEKTQVHQGEPVVFTVTVRNEGTAAATNVVVTDQVPPRLDGVTVTATRGSVAYDSVTRLITLTVGQLNPGESAVMTIKGTAAFVAANETPYTLNNEAVVSFIEGAPRTSNRVTVTVVYFGPGEIPEPGTWLLLGTGLAGLAGYARVRVQARRRKQSR